MSILDSEGESSPAAMSPRSPVCFCWACVGSAISDLRTIGSPQLDSHDDPLARALQPPPDESPDERAIREQKQREATRISHEIDEDIQESRKAFERRKKAIKILLLGACPLCLPSRSLRPPVPLVPNVNICLFHHRSSRIRQKYNTKECVSSFVLGGFCS